MKLSDLIREVGDDNIQFQNLDSCLISANYSQGGGTKITFGTPQPLSVNGTERLGLVVWLDRDDVQRITSGLQKRSAP